MRTLTPPISEADQQWLARRRRLGQDLYDEVWEGTYKVAPAAHRAHGLVQRRLSWALKPHADRARLHDNGPLNIGEPSNFRVPDGAYCRDEDPVTFVPTAAIVVEVVSPGDETWNKLDFYFDHDVEEMLIADPADRSVRWLTRGETGFEPAGGSRLLDVTADWLAEAIDWPPTA